MFCKSCGKEIPENAKFCSGCGTPVSRPEHPPEVPETPVILVPPEASDVPDATEVPNVPDVPEAPARPQAAETPRDDLTAALEPAMETAVAVAPPAEPPAVPPVPPVPPGADAAPAQKKKKTGVIILAAAAVAAVVLVAQLAALLPSGGGKDIFLYRTVDDELMFRKDLKAKTEAVELSDDEPSSIRFTRDGKYIYFMEGYGSSDETADLYRMETAKIGKKGASPEKVSSDVNRYSLRLLPSGGAVYVRGGEDGQLRFFDGKESYKLASDVNGYGFSIDEKGAYAYYTENDPSDYTLTLYRVQIKDGGTKEKLLKDADAIYTDYDAEVLVYGRSNGDGGEWEYDETYDVYSQVPGGEKTKLLSDVSSVLDVFVEDGKAVILYMTANTEKHTLYDFVSDSLASSDAGETEPDYDDYQVQNAWGWMTTDWDAYEEAYEKWYAVENRNYIRQSLKDTEYNITTYNLSRYENGKDTLLAEGLAFAPTYSAADGIYLYARADQEISAVCDVQDLEYGEQVYEKMDAAERSWYQHVGGAESEFDLDEDGDIGSLFILNGSEAVLTAYEDGESEIRAYSVGKNGLTFVSTITDDDYTGITKGRSGGKDAVYYFTDMDSDYSAGELMRYAGGKSESVAKDAGQVEILDDGAVFKMEDVDYNDRRGVTECTLYVMRDGKGERIADDVAVSGVAFLDSKRVVYISDGDLYVWNGRDSEKLASDVEYFWSNRQADRQSFSCD